MTKVKTKNELKTAAIIWAASLIFVFIGIFQVSAQQKDNKISLHSSVNKGSLVETTSDTEIPVQQNSDKVEIINKGVINDQAIYLSQPVYPATAKAAKAKGEVNVEVMINAKGIVVKAKAISGNALLRNTAEWAARRTKFKPSKEENPMFVKGIIVYTF